MKDMNAAVIGAGPAGLMAAETLAASGVRVTVYERLPSAGRKFLLAGRGGLNLTHSENLDAFLGRYSEARAPLEPAIAAFDPAALREWSEKLGQPTFVGSSGRVFPKSFKSSPLLRAWLRRLGQSGVEFRFRHRWTGTDDDGSLIFDTPQGIEKAAAAATILALGGASWPRLGSDGAWSVPLAAAGIRVAPLKPANCGFVVNWSARFGDRLQGQPLKRVELSFGGKSARGDAMITSEGIEGGAVYALAAPLRDAILAEKSAALKVALRPDLSAEALAKKLSIARGKQSFSNFLRKTAGLSPPAIGLLRETAAQPSELSAMTADALAERINNVPLHLTGVAPVETAISTAGGIALSELDENFMLRNRPGTFAAGEMLDWEAPTGGYLLQASFATGAAAGRGAARWLAEKF